MHDAKTLMAPLALRAKIAFAARCAQMAFARLSVKAIGRDRALLEKAIEECMRVAERDDPRDEGWLYGIGDRSVDLSQKKANTATEARLFDAIAGACYAATEYCSWLASSPQKRDRHVDVVAANAARACTAVLGMDPAVDAELLELRDRLAARVTAGDDEKHVPREWLVG